LYAVKNTFYSITVQSSSINSKVLIKFINFYSKNI
jgi:hypothetical protein